MFAFAIYFLRVFHQRVLFCHGKVIRFGKTIFQFVLFRAYRNIGTYPGADVYSVVVVIRNDTTTNKRRKKSQEKKRRGKRRITTAHPEPVIEKKKL